MGLGIAIIIAGFVIGIILLSHGHDLLYFLCVMGLGAIGIILAACVLNIPSANDIRYSAAVENKAIWFSSYSYDGDNIIIPSYYWEEYSWINSWKHCESQATILVPEGVKVDIIDTAKPQARLVSGCE